MSRLSASFESITRLSTPAAEEAHRFGHPAVEVEHVFLALLISQTPAGRLLRDQDIGFDQARAAVQEQHAERIADLGIPKLSVLPRPIPTDGLGEIPWSERVMTILSQVSPDTSGFTLLRALIAEGGGFIAELLERLGVQETEILSALERAEVAATRPPEPSLNVPTAGRRERSYESFVPAPVEQVRELLATPERRPEWDMTIDTIEPDGKDRWIGRSDIQGVRMPQQGRVRTFTLVRREEPHLLEWEHHLPLVRRHRPSRLLIRLDGQSGGTRLHLTMRRPRPVFPLPGFFFTLELAAYANGISRALRP